MGVRHMPEGRRIFARLTVAENLAMGAFSRRGRREVAEDRERMLTLFPVLRERLRKILPERVKPWLADLLIKTGLPAEDARQHAAQVLFGFEPLQPHQSCKFDQHLLQ